MSTSPEEPAPSPQQDKVGVRHLTDEQLMELIDTFALQALNFGIGFMAFAELNRRVAEKQAQQLAADSTRMTQMTRDIRLLTIINTVAVIISLVVAAVTLYVTLHPR